MALALRLGVPVKELMSGDVRCACGAVVDPYGAHYGSGCKVGNRGAAWTARHEMANDETVKSCRAVGQLTAHGVTVNYLGQAAITSVNGGYKRPDGRLRDLYALGRHLYWDFAIACRPVLGLCAAGGLSRAADGRRGGDAAREAEG